MAAARISAYTDPATSTPTTSSSTGALAPRATPPRRAGRLHRVPAARHPDHRRTPTHHRIAHTRHRRALDPGPPRVTLAGRLLDFVIGETMPRGDEVAHYGWVSPAHYGFWTALTERSASVNRLWKDPRRGAGLPGGLSPSRPSAGMADRTARPARPVASTLAAALMLALRTVPPERWTIADLHERPRATRRSSRRCGTRATPSSR